MRYTYVTPKGKLLGNQMQVSMDWNGIKTGMVSMVDVKPGGMHTRLLTPCFSDRIESEYSIKMLSSLKAIK